MTEHERRFDFLRNSSEIGVVPCLNGVALLVFTLGVEDIGIVERTGVMDLNMQGWVPSSSSSTESYQPERRNRIGVRTKETGSAEHDEWIVTYQHRSRRH